MMTVWRHLKLLLILAACTPLLGAISRGMVAASTPQNPEGQKIALLIGNGDYENDAIGDLVGVPRDMDNMSSALAEAGFEVIQLRDAGRNEMADAIIDFRQRMSLAPEGSTGVFYYSGQGMSVSGGDDYLIPTDIDFFKMSSVSDMQLNTISVQDVMASFEFPSNQNIVMALDTCRYWSHTDARGIGLRGLAQAEGTTPPDFFIIWAARAGDIAFDDEDGSAFSRALSSSIRKPGIDVRQVFAEVQSAVIEDSEGRQYPEVSVPSSKPLVLNGAVAEDVDTSAWDSTEDTKSAPLVQSGASSGPRAANISLELIVWESALELGTVESISDFVDRFPESVLIGQARLRLAALRERGAFAPPPTVAHEVFLPTVTMPGPPRIALLIGNKDYAPNMTDLTNPHNDVSLLKDRLLEAGFEVMVYRDVDSDGMAKAVSAFTQKLASASKSDPPVAFFYYSGHGVAPEEAGPNYLAPVGMKVATRSDLIRAQSIEKIIDFVEATKPAFAFFVLDACRNNPGFAEEEEDGNKGDSEWKTLTRVDAVTSSLVAFATAPGAKASDTPDEPVGPYARALADALDEPGIDATRVFKLAQRDVFNRSGHKQVPWVSDALMEDFFFIPEPEEEPEDTELLETPETPAP